MNTLSDHAVSSTTDWLVGGGEMGELIRSMDWSASPLGPRELWPQDLRTTVSLCLACNFPIAIAWGPQRVQLYNDGYRPICGDKHPHSMGQNFRECWQSGWPVIGGPFEEAESIGKSSFLENLRAFIDRYGYLEEGFFTASFSPIHDATGQIVGVFHPTIEATQQILTERRLKALRDLASKTADARSIHQAIGLATDALASHSLDLPFVLIYSLDTALNQARLVAAAGLPAGGDASPESMNLDTSDGQLWPVAHALDCHHCKHLTDLDARFGPVICGPYGEPIREAMLLPICMPGEDMPLAVAVAGISPRRRLDEHYRVFFDMLRDGLTTALMNARAYENERRRAEALAELDQAKTAFFSNVSHEFRTPLTLMLGPLDELLHSPSVVFNKNDRLQVEVAHRNALRLLKLVNSLLDFSRIEAGRAQATYLPTNLAQYTSELAAMFSSVFEKAEIEFVVDCPPLPEPVYVDPDMWEKIVLNLISNAFKFTFSGTIAVRLTWRDNGAELTVSDTGVGVPPDHLPRIFERFHRVPQTRSRSYEGSGIGLALTHELVKLHGGTISADSTLHRGSTFTVFVPGGTAHLPADRIGTRPLLATTAIDPRAFVEEAWHWVPDDETSKERKAPLMSPVPQQSQSTPADGERARILLADDNADMRDFVTRLLAPHCQVEAHADGMQALEAARRDPPDLVLTDVMMPNLDGFGLLRALRSNKQTRSIPVIMLSARAGEEARVEGLEAGADDYLVKPFGARELLARVNTHLDIARMRRDAVESAQHDALTGLPNRRLTMEFADRLFASARRNGKRVGVLFIDMDRFKPINDTYGHKTGDAVLREVAHRLKTCVRAGDIAGRIGGDEFLVILSDVRDGADAGKAAGHIIDSLGMPYLVEGLELHSSPSIGIAVFTDDSDDMEQLIRDADAAMYHAKEKGRNNYQFFTQALNANAARLHHIEHHLRTGLDNGEFQLHYQPVIDISTNELVGVEALLRWPAMDLGPGDFISVAESTGMIDALGDWIVHEACSQIRQWRDRRLPSWTLSINVSPLQLHRNTLHDAIAHALNKNGLDPALLQLEFAETAVLQSTEKAIAAAHSLKKLGVKIALDDFGNGDSNLNCLRLPLDTIKIDQEFVRSLNSDKASMVITEGVISIAQKLGLNVIAEGIESAQILEMLRARNCHQMQGYYLCPPMSAEGLEDWYHQWRAAPERFYQSSVH